MKTVKQKIMLRQKRVWRIRKKVSGTAERPRLCVSFTNKHIYAQAIDDEAGKSLVTISSLGKDLKGEKLSANRESAVRIGKAFAEKAKAAGVSQVVFDRHGRPYHGRVKEFAEAVREGGIQF
ncbi:50S ribosomal protein L18 [Puniceicoccales bacterium CK1056]|uniref:Large ribosomal subunit protein uL18 n=1 Tax=Oceanipulchritudo coccoides TaxID=2706888 RepID=A0A6B2M377_9BACT|nr:50S ribosomal protein L18 [Oceanipulchritudo coccoides]NDV62659.1 50S ribosomal protein L18 [Oceanipulchritudo coccoides]